MREAVAESGLKGSVSVVAERFEKTEPPPADFVTCRAIERFAEVFDRLADWAPAGCTLLMFAGPDLRQLIRRRGLACEDVRVPGSERRFLFAASPAGGQPVPPG